MESNTRTGCKYLGPHIPATSRGKPRKDSFMCLHPLARHLTSNGIGWYLRSGKSECGTCPCYTNPTGGPDAE